MLENFPKGNSVAPMQCRPLDEQACSRRYSVAPAANEDLPALFSLVASQIPDLLGSFAATKNVLAASGSILAVKRQNEVVGGQALLFLNGRGFENLIAGRLALAEPAAADLAGPNAVPLAIYVWATLLPGSVVGATGNIMAWLRQPLYERADLYARPATSKGERMMIKTGFRQFESSKTPRPLRIYRRAAAPAQLGAR